MGRAGSSNLKKNREVQNNQKIQAHLLWGSTARGAGICSIQEVFKQLGGAA
jgi:hypothetical protein